MPFSTIGRLKAEACGVAALVALVMAAPACAATASPAILSPTSTPLDSVPSNPSVASFYDAWHSPKIWFKSGPSSAAASQLVSILRRSPIDGVGNGAELAVQAEAAIARAQSGTPADTAQADRALSAAWVAFVQHVQLPASGIEYAEAWLKPKADSPHQILLDAMRAPDLQAHLASVSAVNPVYAQLRDAAWAQRQAAGDVAPDARIAATLARARVLPARGRYLIVDAATQRLSMYQDGQLQDSMKVIVGKPDHPTPMIASMIYYATFKPYWNIPNDVVKRTVAPLVVKRGASYLKAARYEVASDWSDAATVVPSESVDWKAVAAGEKEVRIRQLPGSGNMMGAMKFSFANHYGIYLHDTPLKQLFAKDKRTLSLGCIRLEDAARLGRWLLQGEIPTDLGEGPEQHRPLPRGVPIYVTYLTAHADGGQLSFAQDVYALDGKPAATEVASSR
jgi:murein L,D-transpeptidase YcbB/YkuD